MRFRVDVEAGAAELAWAEVFGPARAVAYNLISMSDRGLATELHDMGWAGHRLRPLGMSCPQFRGAPPARGRYTTSGNGSVWFGSPVPRIAAALLAGLAGQTTLRWGSADLAVRGVELEHAPDVAAGEVRFTTATPVLVKYRDAFVAPDQHGFHGALVHNLCHKADLLDLPSDVELEILDAGPMRRFQVGEGPRHGATLSVRIAADPRLLAALYDWGLGLANNQGFGWLR